MQTTAFRMETKFDKTSSTTVPQETSENSFRHIATEGSQQSSHRLENTQEETPRKKYLGRNTQEEIPRKKYLGKIT